MNMRATCDPYGHPEGPGQYAAIVDRGLGNAYSIVRYVSYHIEQIKYVAFNMETIHKVAAGMQAQKLVLGVSPQPGGSVNIPFPEGVTSTDVLASSVLIAGLDGVLYGAESGIFTAMISPLGLMLNLKGAAPTPSAGAPVRWFINHAVK